MIKFIVWLLAIFFVICITLVVMLFETCTNFKYKNTKHWFEFNIEIITRWWR